MKLTLEELKELIFEHLSEVASGMYITSKKDDDVVQKCHTWMDYVINEANEGGKFTEWLLQGDDLLSTADFLKVIEYISEYHAQRDLDNGSMLVKSVPNWVNMYLNRQIIIQKGHTEDTILDLFSEALCYMEREQAYFHIILVINGHEDLKTFKERLEDESSKDPAFAKWVAAQLYHRRGDISRCSFGAPPCLERQVACDFSSYPERCVTEDITWDMFYSRYLEDMSTRDQRLKDVTEIIESADLGVIFDPVSCVDDSG